MLSLYARLNHITNSEANREIREALRIENTVYSSSPAINARGRAADSDSGEPTPVALPENAMVQAGRRLEETPQSPPRQYTGDTSDSFAAFWYVDIENTAQIAFAL